MFVRNDNVKRCSCSFSVVVLVVSHCTLNPLRVRGKARVDSRISGARASVTNRHNSTQHPLVTLLFVANHRAARVVLQRWGHVNIRRHKVVNTVKTFDDFFYLASVMTSVVEASTHHVVTDKKRDVTLHLGVHLIAHFVRNHRNLHVTHNTRNVAI